MLNLQCCYGHTHNHHVAAHQLHLPLPYMLPATVLLVPTCPRVRDHSVQTTCRVRRGGQAATLSYHVTHAVPHGASARTSGTGASSSQESATHT